MYQDKVRDKHATISVLTFKQKDFSTNDEYIAELQDKYRVQWLKEKTFSFEKESENIKLRLNATYNKRGHNTVLECLQFGGNSEFWSEFTDKRLIQLYFRKCYNFAIKNIGYLDTDKNIVCAFIVTEQNRRNLFVYYLPITHKWKRKVNSSDKSAKGNILQLRDEFDIPIYNYFENIEKPLLSHSDFWKQRGECTSYSDLQENFFNEVSSRFGAKRGESLSPLKYTNNNQAERFNRKANDDYDIFPVIKGPWV